MTVLRPSIAVLLLFAGTGDSRFVPRVASIMPGGRERLLNGLAAQ
jgi:hypothetical protein